MIRPPEPGPLAREHFRLHLIGGAARIVDQVARLLHGLDKALEAFPFLETWWGPMAEAGVRFGEGPLERQWHPRIAMFAEDVAGHLPIRALARVAQLDATASALLMAVGLIEEEPRFGLLFDQLDPDVEGRRPTVGMLAGGIEPAERRDRSTLGRLIRLGLLQVHNPTDPRSRWTLQCPSVLWDALAGERRAHLAPGLTLHPPESAGPLESLRLPEAIRPQIAALQTLLGDGDLAAVVLRGPDHNGRRTLLRALARGAGRGVIEFEGNAWQAEGAWRQAGALATALRAWPLIGITAGPGEVVPLPDLPAFEGTVLVAAGRHGGLDGPALASAAAFELGLPSPTVRRAHWAAEFSADPPDDLDAIVERYRMSSGNIHRVAALARTRSALADDTQVRIEHVREAARLLNRQALEALAAHLPVQGSWLDLALPPELEAELHELETRCRHRERLAGLVGDALAARLNCGVRALFSGPSGTGKTLAASILASELGLDLYRIDLASIVNKYIGETEKNLERIFSLAEALDVVLLLDEGDALLTRRTQVGSANDRYANLETNFLLQRIEQYQGILLVTTNAAERIDTAFQRRMDVVLEFRAPGARERLAIWHSHLPRDHGVSQRLLRSVASRCELTGGQIRNAVLHMASLAVSGDRAPGDAEMHAALRRAYLKMGAVCPIALPER